MSPTISDRAGGVATDASSDTELRKPQPAAVGRVAGAAAWLGRFLLTLVLFVLLAFTAGLFLVPLALIGIAGVAS
jgi:hypothetical protein